MAKFEISLPPHPDNDNYRDAKLSLPGFQELRRHYLQRIGTLVDEAREWAQQKRKELASPDTSLLPPAQQEELAARLIMLEADIVRADETIRIAEQTPDSPEALERAQGAVNAMSNILEVAQIENKPEHK